MGNTKQAEIQILFKLIEEKTGYATEDLKGERGKRDLAHARRVFFVIARNLLNLTFKETGGLLGRHHTTVIHALSRHEIEMDLYKDYSEVYTELYNHLEAIFVARTEFSEDYLQAQIEVLLVQRNLIDEQIKIRQTKIDKVNAGKEKSE